MSKVMSNRLCEAIGVFCNNCKDRFARVRVGLRRHIRPPQGMRTATEQQVSNLGIR